ncbi:MAG: hypothetical protein LBL31_03255, partial [Spirochaetaceae bacterium]|nr:hypothetical protein [Spirochaetaceae bacterium]
APYAYGWANLLGGKIVVSGGDIGDDLWGLGKLAANVFDPSLDAVDGARVEFKLVDGLSFGYALPLTGTAQPIGDVFGSSVFGGLYKSGLVSGAFGVALHPGTDKVKAGESTWTVKGPTHTNEANGDNVTGQWTWAETKGTEVPAYDPWLDVILGVEVNPIDVLKILVDARIDTRKLQDDKGEAINDKNGYVRIGPLVQYSSGKLVAHARGDITIQNDGFGKDETGKAYKGQKVSYGDEKVLKETKDAHASWINVKNLGDTSIAFRVGAAYQATDTLNTYLQVGSDNVSWFAGNGLYVKPGLKITLGTASIEIFDKLGQIGADKTVILYNDLSKTGDDLEVVSKAHSPFTNQFQIDFNWSF